MSASDNSVKHNPNVSGNMMQRDILKMLKEIDDKTISFMQSMNSLPPGIVNGDSTFNLMLNELRDSTIHIEHAQTNLLFWSRIALHSLERANLLVRGAVAYYKEECAKEGITMMEKTTNRKQRREAARKAKK